MLAKVPDKRGDGRSSFLSLSKYIAEERDHVDPRTGEVTQREVSVDTNCLSADTAWSEMWAVAGQNPRVKDPVYHVVIAWQPGEVPTDEQAFEAAQEAMKAVGMEGHQYVSAVHRDREHHHVHLMVNRVHPETYRAVYPDRDYFKLDKCMREVELRHGWQHSPGPYAVHDRGGQKVVDWTKETAQEWRQQRGSEREAKLPGKARQMEAMTGNESLASYVQSDPKKDVLRALKEPGADWQRLHDALGKHGLAIEPKGQGLIIRSITDAQQTPVKASTMAQELGAGKLQKLLGPYQAKATERTVEPPVATYMGSRPKRDPRVREDHREQRAKDRQELRDRYAAYAAEWRAAKEPAKADMYRRQREHRAALVARHRESRDVIRQSGLPSIEKKALYSVAALNAASERETLNETVKAERLAFRSERPQSLRDWTTDRAHEGDRAAISQLRGWAYADKRQASQLRREEADLAQRPHLGTEGQQDFDPAKPRRITDRVTWSVDRRSGAVDYQVDQKAAFRDSGPRLTFDSGSSRDHDAIEVGLRLASEKFGRIKVFGSQAFADEALKVAVDRGLDVRFSDPQLEAQRVEMIEAKRTQHAGRRQAEQALPPMTPAQREAALRAPEPRINRELVEAEAIEHQVLAYRQKLDQDHQERHGPRPDPERGGLIERMRARKAAEKWDRDQAAYEEQSATAVEDYREMLHSDDPKAVRFRESAWSKGKAEHEARHADWEARASQARREMMAERAAREAKIKGMDSSRQQQSTERRLDTPAPDIGSGPGDDDLSIDR